MELYVYNEIIKPIASYLDKHICQATNIDLRTSVGLIDPNHAWSSKFSSWSEYDMLIVTPQSKGITPATLALCYIDSSHRRAINISFNLSKPPTLHISCNLFWSRKNAHDTSCIALPMHIHYYDQNNYASTFNWADRVLSIIENLFSDHRYYLWPEWSRLRTTMPILTAEAIYSIDNIVKSIRDLGFITLWGGGMPSRTRSLRATVHTNYMSDMLSLLLAINNLLKSGDVIPGLYTN